MESMSSIDYFAYISPFSTQTPQHTTYRSIAVNNFIFFSSYKREHLFICFYVRQTEWISVYVNMMDFDSITFGLIIKMGIISCQMDFISQTLPSQN